MSENPHALANAQSDVELFEVMMPPGQQFNIFVDRPISTGETKQRKLVHRDGDWHRSVHVWIVDYNEQSVVMQKRSPLKDTFPNRWDISSAGHIEAGMGSRETAVKEVAEELGIEVDSNDFHFLFTCPAEQAPIGGCNCYEDVYLLSRRKSECTFRAGEAEVSAIDWVTIDRLDQAWQRQDDAFVPRASIYKKEFLRALRKNNK